MMLRMKVEHSQVLICMKCPTLQVEMLQPHVVQRLGSGDRMFLIEASSQVTMMAPSGVQVTHGSKAPFLPWYFLPLLGAMKLGPYTLAADACPFFRHSRASGRSPNGQRHRFFLDFTILPGRSKTSATRCFCLFFIAYIVMRN